MFINDNEIEVQVKIKKIKENVGVKYVELAHLNVDLEKLKDDRERVKNEIDSMLKDLEWLYTLAKDRGYKK